MTRKNGSQSPWNRLRRSGLRASTGPWMVCLERVRGHGRLIVSLGRAVGPAVTRSRVRRIARDVFKQGNVEQSDALDILLLARSDVSFRPRRKIRADLSGLKARFPSVLARPESKLDTHG